MFVLHPDPYLKPAYRISPFRTGDIALNYNLQDDYYFDEYLDRRFGRNRYLYTLTGRDAINIALSNYNLEKVDLVTILTTTANFYVSSCVTSEIEKFCRWSREVERETKVILVIHEFGYPYPAISELKKTGIPIIEDCAHSFFSIDADRITGTIGDFVIYSFPKMFPIQIGGLLVSNLGKGIKGGFSLDAQRREYIRKVISHYIKSEDKIISKRIYNYNYLLSKLEPLGFEARFQLNEGVVPGVFMFRKKDIKIDLTELKVHFYSHGIQCSVFYGEESFFIPVHQNLDNYDCDYIIAVLQNFI